MFSSSILGTNTNKTKLSWWEYWYGHCWMTGWQTIGYAFKIWKDLMTSNYEGYTLLDDDDPKEECINWFWLTLGEDDVYDKEFLECLLEMSEDIDFEMIKTFSVSDFKELIDEVESLYD